MLYRKCMHPDWSRERVLVILTVTCEGASAPAGWAWRSWRPCPSCWPAEPPRPWSCGCSSLEEFLPHGSSETHLLLETRKVWGGGEDRILLAKHRTFEDFSCLEWSQGRNELKEMFVLTWHSPGGSPVQRCAEESLHGCWLLADRCWHPAAAQRCLHCQRMLPSEDKYSLPGEKHEPCLLWNHNWCLLYSTMFASAVIANSPVCVELK